MAVTLTQAELAAALRLGDTTEETAEVTRLLAYVTEAINKYAPGAPDATASEGAVRLAAYLFDQPSAGRGVAFANAMRNSGAASMLLPYRSHRAGSTATATAEAAAAAAPSSPDAGIDAAAVRALIGQHAAKPSAHHTPPDAADLTAHAADANAHHTPPTSTYTLPAAAAGVRGGVQSITNDIIDNDTSTGVFGWMISHVRRLITRTVPHWARMGNNGDTMLPASVLADDVLTARMFGSGSVDHNALATESVRRAAVLAEAIDAGKLDPAVVARLLAAVTIADNDKVLTVVNGAWAPAVAASGGSARWREMAQVFSSASPGWTVDTAVDAVLRPEGTAVFADAAALRAAIENHRITTFAMQRSDTEEVAIGINAANFRSSMNANYLVCFHFDGGQIVEVRFPTGGVTFTPKFMQPSGTLRLDLAVFG